MAAQPISQQLDGGRRTWRGRTSYPVCRLRRHPGVGGRSELTGYAMVGPGRGNAASDHRSQGLLRYEWRLPVVPAILWVLVVVFAFWLDQYRLAPNDGLVLVVSLVEFVLALVLMPFTIGAYVAWRGRAHAHRVLAGAGAAVLAQWAWLVLGMIARLVFDPQPVMSYFSIDMNVIGSIAILLVFGVDGAVMGAAGGPAAV